MGEMVPASPWTGLSDDLRPRLRVMLLAAESQRARLTAELQSCTSPLRTQFVDGLLTARQALLHDDWALAVAVWPHPAACQVLEESPEWLGRVLIVESASQEAIDAAQRVGAVLCTIDQAGPQLTRVLEQVRRVSARQRLRAQGDFFDSEQARILERLAAGAPLPEVLEGAVRLIERSGEGLCSILLLDSELGTLLHAAAPSLPRSFIDAIDHAQIGPTAGSCGVAAFTGRPVFVRDIAVHPFWEHYRHVALSVGLEACWSTPILSPDEQVLGTFAVYYREPRDPSPGELRRVASASHLAALAIMRDRHEAALRLSEQRQRQLLETSHEGILMLNLSGHITFANQRVATMLGYRPEELVGCEAHKFIHGSEHELVDSGLARRRTGISEQYELRLQTQSGDDLWTIVAASPVLDERGRVIGMLKMLTDISERRATELALERSEQELRLLFESTEIGFALVDAASHPVRFNNALSSMLGYENTELRHTALMDLVHPDDVPTLREKRGLLDAGEPTAQVDLRMLRKDGEPVWLRITTSRFRTGAARELVGVAVFENIAEKKKLEAHVMLAQRMESLGTLAGGIAHDFNNILAAIRGYLDLAIQSLPADSPAQELLAVVDTATDRAAGLVQQILTFSRRKPARRVPCKLTPVIEEVLQLMRATLPRMIELSAEYDASDLPVLADATQIHQIMMNLGTNAAQAMAGHGTITVKLTPVTLNERLMGVASEVPPGPYMRLTVADNGSGMDTETLARIFDPFFTTKAPGAGTGLGLSVVLGIVKDHNGALKVSSQPGAGTTFDIYLPATPVVDQTTNLRSPAPDLFGRGERLLCVDDETTLLRLERTFLESLGYRVDGFSNPLQALQAFREQPGAYAALVTDLAMPELSGIELARAVREIRPELPIILASGYVGPEDRDSARKAGVRLILAKPDFLRPLARELVRLFREPPAPS